MVIDFHSHILPYIDDGAKSFDMSLEMLRISNDDDVKCICATPHYIVGEYEVNKNAYDEKINGLKYLCEKNNIGTNIVSGLEIYINPDLARLYEEGKIWGINDSRYLLIELPMEQFPLYTEEVFYELRLKGATPIIAHPERNIKIMKNPSLLENLIEQGALAQLNAGSLKGLYGKEVKVFAEELVERNMIHIIGSDAHNSSSRKPIISSSLKLVNSLNSEVYTWIQDNEHKILNGEDVDILPIRKKKKFSLFNIFK